VSDKKPVLILGVGNLLLKDEGVGVHVAQRMMAMDLPPDVEVMDGATEGYNLLDCIDGREKVVIVDTVKGGHAPGTVYRMTDDDIEDQPKPRLSLVVFGIEPKDMESVDLELSPEIEKQVPKVIELVLKEIGES